MNKILAAFAKDLRHIAPAGSRPFVCDGSPFECEAFIVGQEVATMGLDFWRFWSDERGFDRDAFLAEYRAERQQRGKRDSISQTRKVVHYVIESAYPVKCLTTNADDLRVLQFLLESIRPKVVLAHGKYAQRAISMLEYQGKVIQSKHFSRGVSFKNPPFEAQRLGREIAAAVEI